MMYMTTDDLSPSLLVALTSCCTLGNGVDQSTTPTSPSVSSPALYQAHRGPHPLAACTYASPLSLTLGDREGHNESSGPDAISGVDDDHAARRGWSGLENLLQVAGRLVGFPLETPDPNFLTLSFSLHRSNCIVGSSGSTLCGRSPGNSGPNTGHIVGRDQRWTQHERGVPIPRQDPPNFSCLVIRTRGRWPSRPSSSTTPARCCVSSSPSRRLQV